MSKAKMGRPRKPKLRIVKGQDEAYWFFLMRRPGETKLEIKNLGAVGNRA